jgi:hypothetical protein
MISDVASDPLIAVLRSCQVSQRIPRGFETPPAQAEQMTPETLSNRTISDLRKQYGSSTTKYLHKRTENTHPHKTLDAHAHSSTTQNSHK